MRRFLAVLGSPKPSRMSRASASDLYWDRLAIPSICFTPFSAAVAGEKTVAGTDWIMRVDADLFLPTWRTVCLETGGGRGLGIGGWRGRWSKVEATVENTMLLSC